MVSSDQEYQDDMLLVQQLQPLLVHYVHQQFRLQIEDAKEIVQDALLKFFKPRLLPIHNKRAWLYKVCRNDALKRIKKRGRETELTEGYSDHGKDPDADTEATVDKQDQLEKVKDAMESMPEKQREFIHMHFFLGMDADEISKALNVSSNTLYQRKHESLKTLKRVLKEKFKDMI